MKKIYLTIKIVANNEVRNVAFAKGINRAINLGNVEKILAMMKVKGYRKAEMVQVVKAEDVITTGDIRLVDINGQDINPEDAAKYFLVLTVSTEPLPHPSIMNGQRRTERKQ